MNKSRSLLTLEALLWLVERQTDQDRYRGDHLESSRGANLADRIRGEIEESKNDAALDMLRSVRDAEKPPVQEGKLKEKENGAAEGDQG